MAIWQHTSFAYPSNMLKGKIFNIDEMEWRQNTLKEKLLVKITELLPLPYEQMGNNYFFGNDKGNSLQVRYDAASVKSLMVRVDMRVLEDAFLKTVCELCTQYDLEMIDCDSLQRLSNSSDKLKKEIINSHINKKLQDFNRR